MKFELGAKSLSKSKPAIAFSASGCGLGRVISGAASSTEKVLNKNSKRWARFIDAFHSWRGGN
tara:strand:+ start:4373 stop:4561 length:189 start_codon:yes stop_codon:yes gene_type:complete